MLALLGSLVADQFAGLVAADAGNVGHAVDLFGGERE
jgi:hypothetical protein